MKKLNDKQLLCLVKTDIESFNDYRKKNPDQKIEFTKLEDINFKNSSLDGANFSNMNLEGLNFADSYMGKVNLKESNIINCDFTRCHLNNSDLRGVKAKNTCFKNAVAKYCDFRGADFESANFNCCSVHYSDFRNSNFNSIQMEESFYIKKIVTGQEWRIDDWYDIFHYVSTIILDKDEKEEEREEKMYEIGTYVCWVVVFLSILALRNFIVGSIFFWANVVVFFPLAFLSLILTSIDSYKFVSDIISGVRKFDGFNFTKYFDEIETWKFRRCVYFGGFSLISFLFFDIFW